MFTFEGLGIPVVVTPDRDSWLASEHVIRCLPREGVEPGALYLAFRVAHVQRQIQALPRGSVVDTLYPEDVERIMVPTVSGDTGMLASVSWNNFACADSLEQRAIYLFEAALDVQRDRSPVSDILLTVEEAAAVLSVSVDDIIGLMRSGVLTELGRLNSENMLVLLDEILNIDFLHAREGLSSNANGWQASYGEVISVGAHSFKAVVAEGPGAPAESVELPMKLVNERDASTLRPGDRFLWKVKAGAQGPSALAESTITVLPRPILTEEEVYESYRWADNFMRNHLRSPNFGELDGD